jgi:hypothetical protein
MSFVDYPGHLIAIVLLGLWAWLMVLAYRSAKGQNVKTWRWLLGSLQYLAIVILFVILWNPSRMEKENSTVRNTVLVFFDTSRSMSIGDCDGKTRLDKAVDVFKNKFALNTPDLPEYRIYGFDADTYYSGSPDSLHRWGSETKLHKVLTSANQFDKSFASDEFSAHGKIAGTLIFTDGQAEEKEIGGYAGILSPQLKTLWIGVGTPELRSDIAVTKITAPAKASIQTSFPVRIYLTGKRLGDQPVKLELYQDDTLVAMKNLPGSSISQDTPVDFLVGADTLGCHTLTAKVTGLQNECNSANNVQHALIDVVEPEKLKVLFYSQVANLDIGKVRQALERDQKIELSFGLDALVATGSSNISKDFAGQIRLPKTRDQFLAYDVIILGPCVLDQLEPIQIEGLYSFVIDRGGGLILLPGRDIYNLADIQNPKMKTLLPVEFGPGSSPTNFTENPVQLTPQGIESNLLTSEDLQTYPVRASAFYSHITPKPAAGTLLTCGADPLVCTHRVGQGFVALINSYGVFEWYRADLQGGFLQRLMSGLTSYTGRVNRLDAGIKLFAKRSSENPKKIIFDALVYDRQYVPVTGATVLLTLDNRKIRMTPSDKNRYRAEVENQSNQNILVHAESQLNNNFLGEKKQVFNLPPCRSEMDQVELDRPFLTSLAEKTSGKYYDADKIDQNVSKQFQATSQVGRISRIISVWPRWSLFLTLCILLSVNWFIKRRLGLI